MTHPAAGSGTGAACSAGCRVPSAPAPTPVTEGRRSQNTTQLPCRGSAGAARSRAKSPTDPSGEPHRATTRRECEARETARDWTVGKYPSLRQLRVLVNTLPCYFGYQIEARVYRRSPPCESNHSVDGVLTESILRYGKAPAHGYRCAQTAHALPRVAGNAQSRTGPTQPTGRCYHGLLSCLITPGVRLVSCTTAQMHTGWACATLDVRHKAIRFVAALSELIVAFILRERCNKDEEEG